MFNTVSRKGWVVASIILFAIIIADAPYLDAPLFFGAMIPFLFVMGILWMTAD